MQRDRWCNIHNFGARALQNFVVKEKVKSSKSQSRSWPLVSRRYVSIDMRLQGKSLRIISGAEYDKFPKSQRMK
jgi:hypothetical protein